MKKTRRVEVSRLVKYPKYGKTVRRRTVCYVHDENNDSTLGDTVEFTSTNPYKIRISGRTKHFINAFGEELMIGNAEAALRRASEATGGVIAEYTAAPIYMKGNEKGAHEWVIEFNTPPSSIEAFGNALDKGLQAVNSDYEAKRFKNTTLNAPLITPVPQGTFVRWMAERGKLGGQNKVPRLFNDRTYVEQLKELIEKF